MMPIEPNLMQFEDGTEVTAAAWEKRRAELREAIIPHEYGGLPPSPLATNTILLCRSVARTEEGFGHHTYEVRTEFAEGELSFLLNLRVPLDGGPFPVVLNGDGCWGYFNDEIVLRTVRRGNIAASFNRTALAADNRDLYRETGLYRLFPEASFGALGAWAWGYHRSIDALSTLDFVRPDQIAITGHSRGGKTVLLAGATDDRIALTNPNGSGTGGSGLNRLKSSGAEVVDDFFRSGNIFWFGSGFAEYRHRDRELPYDQHFLHALIAPRALLASEAHGDVWANPPGSYAACRAAMRVYGLLGAPRNIGWAIREGGHAHSSEDFDALLDFMDARFHGREVVREFQREVYCDLESLLS